MTGRSRGRYRQLAEGSEAGLEPDQHLDHDVQAHDEQRQAYRCRVQHIWQRGGKVLLHVEGLQLE